MFMLPRETLDAKDHCTSNDILNIT